MCNTYNFGDRLRFGITFELPQNPADYQRSFLWGSACYWIFGKCIGDLSYGSSLSSDVWSEIEYLLKYSAKRDVDRSLFFAEGKRILQTRENDIANDVNDIIVENCFGFVGTYEYWERYSISWNLDIMDAHLFLFEYEDQSRIIVTKLDKNKEYYNIQSEHFLKKGEFDAVLSEAFGWLQKRFQHEKEIEEMI
jgi:hypothetical protein